MDIYQKRFEKILEETFNPKKLGALYIAEKIKKDTGIQINEYQKKLIEDQVLEDNEMLHVDIYELEGKTIAIDLGDDNDFEDFFSRIKGVLSELVNEAILVAVDPLLKSLKKDALRMLKEHAAERKYFERDIKHVWGKTLKAFETFLVICTEAGDDVSNTLRDEAFKNNDFVFEVLANLHTRACQVANEVLTLSKAGYADGAHARWRSLHEITVVALFIDKHGKEAAERFIDHGYTVSYKAASLYQKHYEALKQKGLSDKELDKIRTDNETVVNKYDKNFKNDYGWAVPYLKSPNPNPNFTHIQEDVGLAHLFPYLKLASYNVHAGPTRMYESLGMSGVKENLILTGPSMRGLTLPIHSAALSLMQITFRFITIQNTVDNLALCKILQEFYTEIGELCISSEILSEIDN